MLVKKLFDLLPTTSRVSLQETIVSFGATFKKYRSNYLALSKQYASLDQEKLVSIILPTWNRRHIIEKSIESVINQSYKNFELIICDDGSTDNTSNFLKEKYSSLIQSEKIILIENTHQGVSFCRNSGLSISKGDIIAYLDSDNYWDEHYLLIMISSLLDSPQHDCAYSGLKIRNHQTGRFSTLLEENFSYQELSKNNYIDINGFIHSKKMVSMHGMYDTNLNRLVDWDLILRYTKDHPPLMTPILAVNYYLAQKLNNITLSEDFSTNQSIVKNKLKNNSNTPTN